MYSFIHCIYYTCIQIHNLYISENSFNCTIHKMLQRLDIFKGTRFCICLYEVPQCFWDLTFVSKKIPNNVDIITLFGLFLESNSQNLTKRKCPKTVTKPVLCTKNLKQQRIIHYWKFKASWWQFPLLLMSVQPSQDELLPHKQG